MDESQLTKKRQTYDDYGTYAKEEEPQQPQQTDFFGITQEV